MSPDEYVLIRLVYQLVAVPTFLLCLGVVVAYARLIPRERGMVLFFAWSQVLIFGAYASRAFFWATKTWFWPEVPPPFALLRAVVNMPLDFAVMIAAWCALQATYRMIPASERDKWNWWNSPGYPPWSTADLIRAVIGPKLMDRRRRADPDNNRGRRETDWKDEESR